ncbi:uncharacterized protein LOC111266882 isoform X2 [Varroa jacobsoni]|nr:uncharacterized protein LOC111266882 isoform X2 [Varroa jacobsoni]
MVRMGSRPLTVDVLANTALYLRGKAASTKRAIVLPHFDLIKIVNNIPEIEHHMRLRGQHLDLSPLRDVARSYTVIRKELVRLEKEISRLTAQRKKKRDEILEAQIKQLSEVQKNVKKDFYKIDAICAPLLLQIPNTPLCKDIKPVARLCRTYVPPKEFSFKPKNHVELGGSKLQFMNQTLCYLLEDLAGLEQKICSLFVESLDASGRIPVSGADFVLDTVVEGAATGNNIVVEEQDSGGHRMHLTGGSSLEAFCAQLMRREISVSTMRQYCSARFYREGSVEGGLYTLSQSTRVTAFTGSRKEVLSDVEDLLTLLAQLYMDLDVPFRMRLVGPPHLSFVEQLRIDLDVWSPAAREWKVVAHVASHGQFLSSRLHMVSAKEPMFTMFAVCADAQRIIALLLENHQNEDGSYTLPGILSNRSF